jgi:hypothetical protein
MNESKREKLFHVRQYRPAFCTGFTNAVMRDVPRNEVLSAPWLENFKHDDFECFEIEGERGYGDEQFIMARYRSGKRYVAGFVLPADSRTPAPDGGLLADNWRYKEHRS